jgi:hypothetical protein
MDAWAYFRFTSLSLLLGFAFFCLCSAAWAWRRRQQRNQGSAGSGAGLRKWSRRLLLAGIVLGVVTVIINEVVPIRGVMRLDESFAARARSETDVTFLAPNGPIRRGEVLVRFEPGNYQAEHDALVAQHEKLAADLEKTEAMPLELDEELVRAHQNVLARVEQAQGTLNAYVPLLTETVRIGLEKHLDRDDQCVSMNRLTIDFEATHKQSLSEYQFRFQEYDRAAKISDQQGAVTASDLDQKRHNAVHVAEQIKKLERSLEHFKHETSQLKENMRAFDELVQRQSASLSAEIERFEEKLREGEQERAVIEQALARDRLRAERQREAELRMIKSEMKEIAANIRSLEESQRVLAPFDGEVVYRSAAPNSVNEHGVLVILAERNTAEVRFSVRNNLVPALDDVGRLDVWIPDSALARCVSGEVLLIEDSPNHVDHSIVTVGCRPPMDVLPKLADEELVPIQMTWSPPLTSTPVFQAALLLCGLGILCGIGASSREAPPVDADQGASTGEPNPDPNGPSGVNIADVALHHGPAGTMLVRSRPLYGN